MEGFAKVRLRGKDYSIPSNFFGLKLVRVTDNPLNPNKLLVWRQQVGWGGLGQRSLLVHEAKKTKSAIMEGEEIADLVYNILGREQDHCSVWDFKVSPKYRRKTLGTALRETMLQDLKRMGVKEITFPAHEEEGFYLKRGFKKDEHGHFTGQMRELGVRPGAVKLKVLWQRSRPRF